MWYAVTGEALGLDGVCRLQVQSLVTTGPDTRITFTIDPLTSAERELMRNEGRSVALTSYEIIQQIREASVLNSPSCFQQSILGTHAPLLCNMLLAILTVM